MSGLVSGLDSGKIVEATLKQKRIPIQRMEAQKVGAKAKVSKVNEIIGKMNDLKTKMENLDEQSEVLKLTGNTGDEEVLTVSATGDASPGSYDIQVEQLATHAKYRTDGWASKDDAVRAGTIQISVNGADDDFDAAEDVVSITVEEGDSIAAVLDKINDSDAEVNASFVFDGTKYYLQITNKESGFSRSLDGNGDPDPATESSDAAQALVVSFNGTGATGTDFDFGSGGNLVDGDGDLVKNAKVTLDGLDMEFQDNSLGDVLDGVTLDLVETGDTTFEVTRDKEGTKEQLQGFVDSYNEVIDLINKSVAVTENSNRGRTLAGDSTIQHLKNSLRDLVSGNLDNMTGDFSALSHIGITSNGLGRLTLSSDDLSDALEADMDSVGRLFSQDTDGLADLLIDKVDAYTDSLDGILMDKKDSLNDQVRNIDKRIFRLEDRISRIESQMVKKFSRMEVTISMLQAQGQSLTGLAG